MVNVSQDTTTNMSVYHHARPAVHQVTVLTSRDVLSTANVDAGLGDSAMQKARHNLDESVTNAILIKILMDGQEWLTGQDVMTIDLARTMIDACLECAVEPCTPV